MKLSHILIAGLLSSALVTTAGTNYDKAKKVSTNSATKANTKKTKTIKKKSLVVNKEKVCEACGRG